jgi:hypothetical protein
MRELDTIARIVEASEEAYTWEMEVARLRRETLREAVISILSRTPESTN